MHALETVGNTDTTVTIPSSIYTIYEGATTSRILYLNLYT